MATSLVWSYLELAPFTELSVLATAIEQALGADSPLSNLYRSNLGEPLKRSVRLLVVPLEGCSNVG
jgi:hypothetical protein